jgi:hypothetical protein
MFKAIVGAFRFVSVKPIMAAGLAACLSLSGGAARADLNLSTGIDVTGNIDNIWHVTSSDVVLGSNQLQTLSPGYPSPPWVADDGSSKWLVPVSTGQDDAPVGTYYYTASFTVTAADALAGAIVQGRYLSDNAATSIILQRGADTPINLLPLNNTSDSFYTWTTLNNSDPLAAGSYTLTFAVHNDNDGGMNPTGFRFDGGVTSVPEPGSLVLGALSTLALGGLSWKRRAARQGARPFSLRDSPWLSAPAGSESGGRAGE